MQPTFQPLPSHHEAAIGHYGDLEDGGDRTLCWADEADAQDDPGVRAVATIKIHERRK
jgi:hypothetical protein